MDKLKKGGGARKGEKKVSIPLNQLDHDDQLHPQEKDIRLIREMLAHQSRPASSPPSLPPSLPPFLSLTSLPADTDTIDANLENLLFQVQAELTRELVNSAEFYARYARRSSIEASDLEWVVCVKQDSSERAGNQKESLSATHPR